MANKKQIPCRVCGTMFTPCAYCQSHSDTFRWRNFACSIECAQKYISDTLNYRESLKKPVEAKPETVVYTNDIVEDAEQPIATKKKTKRKNPTETVETKIENNETE